MKYRGVSHAGDSVETERRTRRHVSTVYADFRLIRRRTLGHVLHPRGTVISDAVFCDRSRLVRFTSFSLVCTLGTDIVDAVFVIEAATILVKFYSNSLAFQLCAPSGILSSWIVRFSPALCGSSMHAVTSSVFGGGDCTSSRCRRYDNRSHCEVRSNGAYN